MRTILLTLSLLLAHPAPIFAAPEKTGPITIGFIGSLSNFAASYGSEALQGVTLAIEEANASGQRVTLLVEDDHSEMKHAVSALASFSGERKIDALITGTWWANALVKKAEPLNIPFLSVETAFNADTVLGKNYFLMLGDLREWVRAYEPIIEANKYKKGAIVRFISGFGETLAEAFKAQFSAKTRSFLGAIEYTEIDAHEARAYALKLKALNPDVVYLDTQPSSLATLLTRLREIGLGSLPIFANSVARDMCQQKLFDCAGKKNLFFTARRTVDPEFAKRFTARFGHAPYLEGDLGYYAAKLSLEALRTEAPVEALKGEGLTVDGIPFTFDARNVLTGLQHEVWEVRAGEFIKVSPASR